MKCGHDEPSYFDHLQMCATEFLAGPQQCGHDGLRRMCMNNGAGIALTIWQHKQWRTLALLQSARIKREKNNSKLEKYKKKSIRMKSVALTFCIPAVFECHRHRCSVWKDLRAQCAPFAHRMALCRSHRCEKNVYISELIKSKLMKLTWNSNRSNWMWIINSTMDHTRHWA